MPQERPAVTVDSTQTVVISFPDSLFEAYRSDAAFHYDRNSNPTFSIWALIKYWIRHFLERLLSPRGATIFLNAIYYLIIAALIAFAISRFMNLRFRSLFYAPSQKDAPVAEFLEKELAGINFEHEIQKAIEAAHYRDAIRWLYLKGLKKLSDKTLINWHPEKTNHDYIVELTHPELRDVFVKLTSYFEYAWYGDIHVSHPDFLEAERHFHRFFTQMDEQRL